MRKIKLRRRNFKAEKEDFYRRNGEKIDELLAICKRYQGEYIPVFHGPGSWATTYSNEFVMAASELYQLFLHSGLGPPEVLLSEAFRSAEVCSCRGKRMTADRVEYLYENHIKSRIHKDH